MSRRSVFLVHGRDHTVRDDLIALLRAFDLRVVRWREAASRAAAGGTPHTDDIVRAGMDMADAVVILFTPDDIGYVQEHFRQDRDGHDELEPTGQARLNVIFEAGMAIGIDRSRVVMVEVGATRALSDTVGINTIRLGDQVESRKDLAARLRDAGLNVDTDGEEWRTTGTFDRRLGTPGGRRPPAQAQPQAPTGSPQPNRRTGGTYGPDSVRLTETLVASNMGRLDSQFSSDVVGEVTNESDASLTLVMLEATFYNATGRIVGSANGGVNGLPGGATKSFRLSSAGVIEDAVNFKVQSNGQM